MTPEQRLQVLQEQWFDCKRCRLHKLREAPNHLIFGEGPVPADMMFIGSHPTSSDEEHCYPFSGLEGELLLDILEHTGIDPGECYRTYVVACRPKVLIPATEEEDERVETVAPQKTDFEGLLDKETKERIYDGCQARLWEQIYQVDPRIIVTFGDVPLKFLKARDNNKKLPRKMADAQKELYEIRIPGRTPDVTLRYPVMAALDMGYLIKNPSVAEHGSINIVTEALRRARAYANWLKQQEEI